MAVVTTHQAESTRSKLAIVGSGSVGSSLAYAALIRGSAHEIVLYDIDEKKVAAEAADLSHGTQFTQSHKVAGSSDIGIVKDASVVVITAGAKQREGQTLLDLAGVNAKILSGMLPQLLEQAPNAIYVLVTNPCDVLTVIAQKISGLPTSRVFSTGTMLDTSRLRRVIADKIGIAQNNVHATIMGEHGDTEFPVWSTATIGSIPIRDWRDDRGELVFTDVVLEELADEAMHAAYRIIEGKGVTNYAIGLTGARLVEALLGRQEWTILPLSSVQNGFEGISGVALSVPSVVSERGIDRVLDIPLDDKERAMLHRSAETLAASLRTLGY